MKILFLSFAFLCCTVQALTPAPVTHSSSSYEPSKRYLRTSNKENEVKKEVPTEPEGLTWNGVCTWFNDVVYGENGLASWFSTSWWYGEEKEEGEESDEGEGKSSPAKVVASSSTSAASKKTKKSDDSESEESDSEDGLNDFQKAATDAINNLTKGLPSFKVGSLDSENLSNYVADVYKSANDYCAWVSERASSVINDSMKSDSLTKIGGKK
ncbi:hypothetical protein BBOV_I001020 [Babesia bovis T2Bo]|uniref:Uncharacterized protein n=1 Tax=Babesia bovis TaxID=5865 RepID=A7AXC2_BABBO|nr:hypothetical protein BBOV_I001020 [Babesia bovis T2Bo]EDO05195.1 hypothetical protein BBOV_I001020 [Babesia bovis T2Bo]BAN64758.1 hypothetical protein [Babesia bovis]|eukprot:XP_001608763.1 hypothetical protein [Babesia bovis T2Bo]